MCFRPYSSRLLSCLALLVAVAVCSALAPPARAAETVRMAVLKFGTINWELDVVRHHGFDKRAGIDLKLVELVGKQATAIALQSNAVDIIATDWLWVSRRRASGGDETFVPHSLAAGGIMVPANSDIASLRDLEGRRLGVAGGPVDKSWLFLRAYGQKVLGVDLSQALEPAFAAPPLLSESLRRGDLPAVLNFWHYNARLKAGGARELISVAAILKGLGLEAPPPILGWVFHQSWAAAHPDAISGFLKATHDAEVLLAKSDDEWRRIRPLTGASSDAELVALRQGYRQGIVLAAGPEQEARAAKAFDILAKVGGEALVGPARHLAPGTFWAGSGQDGKGRGGREQGGKVGN